MSQSPNEPAKPESWMLSWIFNAADVSDLESWVPSQYYRFATPGEVKAAADDLIAEVGAFDYRAVPSDEPATCQYHPFAGLVTVKEAAELNTPR